MEGSAPTRNRRIDILRGIAVFGILPANVWLFAFPGSGMSETLSAHSSWMDQAVALLVATFVDVKFYPLFAFLFGVGFILQTDRLRAGPGGLAEAKRLYRRRLWWLLGCGLAVGLLLFRAEILTAYALVGFWLLHVAAGRRTSELVRILKWVAVVGAVMFGVALAAVWVIQPATTQEAAKRLAQAAAQTELYMTGSWPAIMRERALHYLRVYPAILGMFPHIALCFMLGAVATRLGWVTRPERYRAGWRRVRAIALLLGLPANLALAWYGLDVAKRQLHAGPAEVLVQSLIMGLGPLLTAAYVAHLMLFGPQRVFRWAKWLAPVGRMALTNYVVQAFLLCVMLQGTGLGLAKHLSYAGLLGLCIAIMAVQLVWSRRWLARHRQGPLEALWRRYTYR